jgi:hypothetical protein
MKVIFKCNLDLVGEQWPSDIPFIPSVGEYIESMTLRQRGQVGWRLKLKVAAVTWSYTGTQYVPVVELGDSLTRSVNEFHAWYRAAIRES